MLQNSEATWATWATYDSCRFGMFTPRTQKRAAGNPSLVEKAGLVQRRVILLFQCSKLHGINAIQNEVSKSGMASLAAFHLP